VTARTCKAFTYPTRHRNTDCVADQLPPESSFDRGAVYGGSCPVRRKPLETLGIANVWRYDAAVARQPNRGGRWDADRRTALQRRDCIDGPPKTTQSLGPVEATRHLIRVGWKRLLLVPFKEDATRIFHSRGEQYHSLSPLRQPKGPSVDDAVRPGEAQIFEFIDQHSHGSAAIELQHERDVLED
jgi:hypothetical protein